MIVYGRSIAPRGSFRSKHKVNGLLHDAMEEKCKKIITLWCR